MLVLSAKRYMTFQGTDSERITLTMPMCPVPPGSEGMGITVDNGGHQFAAFLEADELRQMAEFLQYNYSNPVIKLLRLVGNDNKQELRLTHSNMGEPYREGIDIGIEGVADFPSYLGPFVESFEQNRMREFILEYLDSIPQDHKQVS